MRRDDDGHLAVGEALEPFQELRFAAHVKMRRGLIQKQNLRPSDQDARKPNRLFLTPGKASPAFGDGHLIAQRMGSGEAFNSGKLCGSKDLFIGCGGPAKRDVVAQLAEEEICVLQYETDAGPQVCRIVLACIHAIDQYPSVLRIVESDSEPTDRGLAGSDAPDNADPFTRRRP